MATLRRVTALAPSAKRGQLYNIISIVDVHAFFDFSEISFVFCAYVFFFSFSNQLHAPSFLVQYLAARDRSGATVDSAFQKFIHQPAVRNLY